MSTAKRPTAPRQAKPAQRYFRGKAPTGPGAATTHSDSDSDVEGDEDEEGVRYEEEDVPVSGDRLAVGSEDEDDDDDAPTPARRTVQEKGKVAMNVSLKDVSISEGKVIVSGRVESGRTERELEDESGSDEEEEAGAPGAEEEESSEEESSSEDETPAAPAFRPVFVPKRGRVTVLEREQESQNTEEAEAKREAEAEKRKKESHDLVAESIKRELAEKEAQEVVPDIDDTDGLDPTSEFEDWRLRELSRIKRDKEAALAREEEREEIERRRALPEAQRLAEDMERANKSREEKPKGQQKFLQKYFHKGAFHQDEEILKKRDYTEATESTIDVSVLPKVMQVKNFGKRSQTKYTHLLDQDTSREPKKAPGSIGGVGGGMKDGQGCFNCGGPHLARDCPNADQRQGPSSRNGPGRPGGSGANGGHVAVTGRQWGVKRDRDMPPPDAPSGPRAGNGRSGEDGEASRRSWKDRDPDPRRDRDGDGRDRDFGGRDRDRDRDRDRRPNDYGRDRDRDRDRKPTRRDYSRTPPRRRSRSRSPARNSNSHRRQRSRSRSRSPSLDRYDKRRRRD